MGQGSSEAGGRSRVWRFRRVVTRYANPVLRPLAKKLPYLGVLTYAGRKSGRIYQTPLNVFRRGDVYVFLPTYGSEAQWVKNVLASGFASLETRGRVVDLLDPELITDPELRIAPPIVRFVERRVGVTQYLQMHTAHTP